MKQRKIVPIHIQRQLSIQLKGHNRKNNRSRLDLINDVLEVSQYPSSYWNIICLVSTSSVECKKLVTFLISCELLETYEKGSDRYRTTEKGFLYLEKYREMMRMLEWKENNYYQFPKKYHCSLCNMEFDKKGQLKLHKQEHAY